MECAYYFASWKFRNGGFPCHQGCQSSDFIQIDSRVIPQSTFHGAPGIIVLHSVPEHGFNVTIIAFESNLHGHFTFGRNQELTHPFRHFELVCGLIEIKAGGFAGFHETDLGRLVIREEPRRDSHRPMQKGKGDYRRIVNALATATEFP